MAGHSKRHRTGNSLRFTGVYCDVRLISLLPLIVAASSNNPEAGTISVSGSVAILRVESPRPLDSAAVTVAETYHWVINAEDPPYACADDLKDISSSQFRQAYPGRKLLIPKGGALEVSYRVPPNGEPLNPEPVLRQIVSTYNSHFPFRYRVETQGDVYSFVPEVGRNSACKPVSIARLLDMRMSIPKTATDAQDMFTLLGRALSKTTGLHVSCGFGIFDNGLAQTPVVVEATGERARDVLLRMTKSIGYRMQWLERSDPTDGVWMINMQYLTREVERCGIPTREILRWPGVPQFRQVPEPPPRRPCPPER